MMAEDHVYTIEGARQFMNERGFTYTFRQVQRMATKRRLPFKPGPDGRKLFITERALTKALGDLPAESH